MFNNSGKKIRLYALIIYVLGAIGVLVAAIIIAKASSRSFNFVLFLSIFVGGELSIYLISLFISAFGEAIQHLHDINDAMASLKAVEIKLDKLLEKDSSANSARRQTQHAPQSIPPQNAAPQRQAPQNAAPQNAAAQYSAPQSYVNRRSRSAVSTAEQPYAAPIPAGNSRAVKCPVCGFEQSQQNAYCQHCGSPMNVR